MSALDRNYGKVVETIECSLECSAKANSSEKSGFIFKEVAAETLESISKAMAHFSKRLIRDADDLTI